MGERGPVPKRSTQRRRANKPEVKVESAPSLAPTAAPAADENWHPIARMWFESHAKSGQSIWFQPSDWAEAFFLAEVMSEALAGSINGPKLSAILGGSSRLMTTEGDRRRLRIELERPNQTDADEDAAVSKLDDYRTRISG